MLLRWVQPLPTKCPTRQPTCPWDLGGPRKRGEAPGLGPTWRQGSWTTFPACPKGLGEQQPEASPRHWVAGYRDPYIHWLPVSCSTPWLASIKKSRVLGGSNRGKCWNAGQLHGQRTGNVYPVLSQQSAKKASFSEGQRQHPSKQTPVHPELFKDRCRKTGHMLPSGWQLCKPHTKCVQRQDCRFKLWHVVQCSSSHHHQRASAGIPTPPHPPTTSGWCGRWNVGLTDARQVLCHGVTAMLARQVLCISF